MTNTWRTFILLTILVSVYGQPLKALRIEENDPSITYTGTCYSNSAASNSGGRRI